MGTAAPRLVTGRLVLEGIAEKDTELIVRWRSEPDVYRFFRSPHPLGMGEHLDWFRNRYLPDANRFDWVAAEKNSGEPVGLFGLRRESGDLAQAEVSYLLAPGFQGKGYASEAVWCLMGFASGNWGCNTCIAEIHADNHASVKFAAHLGFKVSDTDGCFVRYRREI